MSDQSPASGVPTPIPGPGSGTHRAYLQDDDDDTGEIRLPRKFTGQLGAAILFSLLPSGIGAGGYYKLTALGERIEEIRLELTTIKAERAAERVGKLEETVARLDRELAVLKATEGKDKK